MNEAISLKYHRPPMHTTPEEIQKRIVHLRSVALTLDAEAAARLNEFILSLEVQLLEAS